jgi:hypothetical protein
MILSLPESDPKQCQLLGAKRERWGLEEAHMIDYTEIISTPIRGTVEMAIHAGNSIKVISLDWKPKQVVFMEKAMSRSLCDSIKMAYPELEYLQEAGTPHNPATEDFVDRKNDVCLSFPAVGESRRWYP